MRSILQGTVAGGTVYYFCIYPRIHARNFLSINQKAGSRATPTEDSASGGLSGSLTYASGCSSSGEDRDQGCEDGDDNIDHDGERSDD
jgi:hypothetical protein